MTSIIEDSSEEKLVLLCKQGDQDAFSKLLNIYTPLIHYYSNKYFAQGWLPTDLFQEGCIGLYVAILRFEAEKGSFPPFAQAHIKSQIINAVKKATRKKQQILNDCRSYFEVTNCYGDTILDQLAGDTPTPEQVVVSKEEMKEKRRSLIRIFRSMTRIERQVFLAILGGNSYKEASELIGVNAKSVDNALRRIKKKAQHKAS